MQLTNKYGYPSCVVAMASSQMSKPDPHVLRVTSLISSPLIRHYQLSNWDEIVIDVDDFIYAGFGTAWHQYLASFDPNCKPGFSPSKRYYSEQTLQVEHRGLMISGTPDLRSRDGDIDDYKVTSAWSFVFAKPEWEYQLNTYALLAEANGFPISALHINAFLRDWSALNYMRYRPDYPERPFYCTTIPLWSKERRKEFVDTRVKDHLLGPRPCTPEERWQRPTTWAVHKRGVKKASRVLDSEEDAVVWQKKQKLPADYYIECRPGGCRKCEDYCSVRSVCEYKQ